MESISRSSLDPGTLSRLDKPLLTVFLEDAAVGRFHLTPHSEGEGHLLDCFHENSHLDMAQVRFSVQRGKPSRKPWVAVEQFENARWARLEGHLDLLPTWVPASTEIQAQPLENFPGVECEWTSASGHRAISRLSLYHYQKISRYLATLLIPSATNLNQFVGYLRILTDDTWEFNFLPNTANVEFRRVRLV